MVEMERTRPIVITGGHRVGHALAMAAMASLSTSDFDDEWPVKVGEFTRTSSDWIVEKVPKRKCGLLPMPGKSETEAWNDAAGKEVNPFKTPRDVVLRRRKAKKAARKKQRRAKRK